ACARGQGGQVTARNRHKSGPCVKILSLISLASPPPKRAGARSFAMLLHPAMKNGERNVVPFRSVTMSTQIVAQVREALFAKELRPGDFLGTEKDLAERFAVSRIVARDALRT